MRMKVAATVPGTVASSSMSTVAPLLTQCVLDGEKLCLMMTMVKSMEMKVKMEAVVFVVVAVVVALDAMVMKIWRQGSL